MHTLSRDPKREVDSEISCASRWHPLSFPYDLPKVLRLSFLFRVSLSFDPPQKSSSRYSSFNDSNARSILCSESTR